MESADFGTAIAQRALLVAMELSLPVLLVGMFMGLLVSVFQAVTQIQEQTLSFIPKALAMAAALFLLLPRLLTLITGYMQEVLGDLGQATLL
jgi:flagellar biosynthetic protein FliQ